MAPMEHEEYHWQISEFLEKGYIRKSQLPFAA
jgi:hypothetical protein